ncbi:MAG: dihydrodipicolinate synthase family protein [Planctomycetes bacterium]|nr:dihydrodipicolinate synthase family protein [Planctomycetota bacterium]
MTTTFSGIWPAMLTPLDKDGKPAFDILDELIELFVQQGLDGIYLTGSTGQWPLLSFSERCAITERVLRAAQGRLPVMVHVGAVATDEAVELARHAARAGAQAVSSVTPIYYAHSSDVNFEHYRRIGAASDLPLYVYHLSIVAQPKLAGDEYVERLLAVPNIAGMKITDGDLFLFGLIHAKAGQRLRLFSGADEVMCQAAVAGAIGAIGTFYNVWGPTCRKVRQAFVAGDFEAGKSFMSRFQAAIASVLASGSVWTFLRAAMRLKYGIDVGMPRAPLGIKDRPWDDGEVRRVIDLVDRNDE